MLPKDSMILQTLRELFGFYNYQLTAEFQRMILDRTALENKAVIEFSEGMAREITSMHVVWATLKAKCMEIGFEMIPEMPYLKA
jgi:hypothetical protein